MKKLAALCFLSCQLWLPVTGFAIETHRYYDREHHDYHYWTGDEDRQYRAYLVERHQAYVPFVSVGVRHRQEYFKYRHENGFKVEVR